MHPNGRLSLTLAILKPDLLARPIDAAAVRQRIVMEGFLVLRSRVCQFTLNEAQAFYSMHSGKEFFARLTRLMSSGPINPLILAHEGNAIERWRELMGPTKRASVLAPGTIRASYTSTETQNAVHGADSEERVKKEIRWFFPEFCFEEWERNQYSYATSAVYNESLGIHETVRQRIVKEGFLVLRSRVCQFTLYEAQAFYSMHSGKEFFARLTRLMSSGPINPLILAHEGNAIERWRELMGPTKRASVLAPGTIRASYTSTETQNAVHGADSEERVKKEIRWFFPEFCFEEWERNQYSYATSAVYNESLGIHEVL